MATKKSATTSGKKKTTVAKPKQTKTHSDEKNALASRVTIDDIIAKRKSRWNERKDIEYDKKLVKASVQKILSEAELRDEIVAKPYRLIEVAFCIVDKKRNTVPFFFNEVQADFITKLEEYGTKKPFFILKGRQQGFTSVITAIQLAYSIVRKNFSGFTMADRTDNTMAIFNDKARVVYDRLPDELKPHEKFNSRNEMFFDKLNSSWRIATATDQVGRSRTLNFVHFSEVAFYECSLADLQAGIGEAITNDAIQVYETTANGFNQAKDLWDSGACQNLFYQWWRSPEYRSTDYAYLEGLDGWLSERVKTLASCGCDKDQITWYCKKYKSYLNKDTIKQEYPITPEEAFISSGSGVFDKEQINKRLIELNGLASEKKGRFEYSKRLKPIEDGNGKTVDYETTIESIRFVEDRDGYITIHKEPEIKVENQCKWLKPYTIGGDTAGSGQDYFTAKVVDSIDGRCVATFRKQFMDDDLYAEQMYCLGKYYNDALISIEINYSRQPTRVLQRVLNYPNLYVRETVDGMTDTPRKDYGFATTTHTKPIIIGELVALFRDNPYIECDKQTLLEMSYFVRKDNGKMEAVDGQHDDLVMASAIAHFCSKSQTHEWIKEQVKEDDFIEKNFNIEASEEGNGSFMSWDEL